MSSVLVIRIGEEANAVAGPDLTIDCRNPSVMLTSAGSSSGPSIKYEWNGPGITGANRNLPNIVISTEGTYILTVEDTFGNCFSMDTVVVTSNIAYPEIDAGPNAMLSCEQSASSVILKGGILNQNGNMVIKWLGPDITPQNETQLQPEVTNGGLYILTVTDTVNGCESRDTMELVVDFDFPIISAGPDMSLTCEVSEVTLQGSASNINMLSEVQWDQTGGISFAEIKLLNPSVDEPGTYILRALTPNSFCNRFDTVIVTIDTIPPTVNAGDTAYLGCSSSEVTLAGMSSDSDPRSVLWTTSNGMINGAANQSEINISGGGRYYYEVISKNGCIGLDSVDVIEVPPFEIDVVTTPSCEGERSGKVVVILTRPTTGPYVVTLNGMEDRDFKADSTAPFVLRFPGTYNIRVVDALGCIKRYYSSHRSSA